MTDPLALLPLAIAAGGGAVDGFEAGRLVAAGFTLLQRSPALVRALAGRRAAILLPTSHRFITALAACDGRGAVLVNPLAAPAEIAHQLDDADVGAVFTVSAFAARLPAASVHVLLDDSPRTASVVAGGGTKAVDLGAHVGLSLAGEDGAEGRDEEAAIVYTSAMAGRPLGAILTHRNLIANARSTVVAAGTSRDDHTLALLPFSHLFGLTVTASTPLLVGARVTTVERFHPGKVIALLAGGGITQLVGVPAVYAALLDALSRRGARFESSTLRLCICGGAPLATPLQERWAEATGVELRQGYGLTEAGPVCLFNPIDRANQRGALGIPFPSVEVEIRDAGSGASLPDGTVGEICVRGPNVFRGYVSGGDLGLRVRDGWLHTGDDGVRDAGGAVHFRGVRKAMFTRSAFNIYPREIQRAVEEMPGVSRAVVRAIPEPSREHDIGLVVEGTVSADEVKRWCEGRLSAYKQPSAIEVWPPAR